jgi:1,2-dihydroxy-3-keto-5-methylthiopentene dioxygenase
MRAYFYDNLPGSQILKHDSGKEVSVDQLRDLGVFYWYLNPHDISSNRS